MHESLKHVVLLAVACGVVGLLATFGVFDSVQGFPLVFASICLVAGLHRVWRDRPRRSVASRVAILLAGVALAVGGWLYRQQAIDASRIAERARSLEQLAGYEVPPPVGLRPIDGQQAAWDAAASFDAPATIVTFWARWCTPCEKEMPELEAFYRQQRDRGLRVLAVTRFRDPDDESKCREDIARAREFLERRDLTFPSAITSDEDFFRAYRAWSIPRTVLVDAEGKVVDYAISVESVRLLMARAAELLDGLSTS